MFEAVFLAKGRSLELEKLHKSAFTPGWSAADFDAYIESVFDDVLAVVEQDEICGFIVLRTQADQSEVLTVVVREDKRGHGLGRTLLIAGEDAVRARGASIVFLEVAKDNPAAIHLYAGLGFQRCGTRKGYYRREKGRVDALLFQKSLS